VNVEAQAGPLGGDITRPLAMGRRLIDDIHSVPEALAIAESEA